MSARLQNLLTRPTDQVLVSFVLFPILVPSILIACVVTVEHFSLSISKSAFGKNSLSVMTCTNVKINPTNRGFADFTVLFSTNFQTGIVFKTPMTSRENLLKIGTDVIWHGTHNIEEMKDLPRSNLTFTNKQLNITLSFYIHCPELEILLLKQYRHFWKNVKKQNKQLPSNNETVLKLSGKHEIHCSNVTVYEPLIYVGPVEYIVTFPNPFGIELTNVTKYSILNEDKFVNTGNEIVWYGSAKLGNGLSKSLLSFQRKHPSARDNFELVCPSLELKVQEMFSEQWENYNDTTYAVMMFLIVTLSGPTLIGGLFCGDYFVRKAARKALN